MSQEAIAELTQREGGRVMGVGVGCPGPLDREAGLVIESPNLGWTRYPVRDRISQGLGLPTSLDNDANCATYGEWWRGSARGARSVVGITLGTGVGGGLVVNGDLVRGASGAAGELGHTIVEMDGRPCPCGSRGCLEAYVSGRAIAELARERLDAGKGSILSGEELSAACVFDAAAAGDDVARDVVRSTARTLGAGLASVVNLLSPEVVVMAGGVAASADQLLASVRREVNRRSFRFASRVCSIVRGSLGDAVGIVGAVGIYLDDTRKGLEQSGRQ